MLTIKQLTDLPFDALFDTWHAAFAGYARTWTRKELQTDMRRRGYTPQLSFGAFDGDKLVSFILNASGQFNTITTAYDMGTGTIPGYRGRKLVTQIFDYSVPHLLASGNKQYLLEVLQENEKAIKLYKHAGFVVSRELNYFVHPAGSVRLNGKALPGGYVLKEIAPEQLPAMQDMWDFYPSWQNSFDSINRGAGFKAVAVYDCDRLAGYGIIAIAQGDIPQLAVARQYRRQGIGSAIMKALIERNEANVVKVVNTDKASASHTAFLEDNGMLISGAQYEMVKTLYK